MIEQPRSGDICQPRVSNPRSRESRPLARQAAERRQLRATRWGRLKK
ncbi:hypothetical protein RISK_003257 [Rhodopirellula islandica]|uniref:Uncharacterized protein n=1 Tax=Rhodopirellula islandica TaxID=595434 RepID=A0A0J1BDK8_RHOIS|nr:hypothetical protein RISK_003257 [Rhodopirellula islandica]